MAEDRKDEAKAPHWTSGQLTEASSHPHSPEIKEQGGAGAGLVRSANGFPYQEDEEHGLGGREQPGPYAQTKENGINGELSAGDRETAEEVSARIVQVVTAEAVAVLKGEQEKEAQHKEQPGPLPIAVEESANLPPSPPPSPASEQTGALEEAAGGETNQAPGVFKQAKEKLSDGVSKSPEKRSSLPRPSSILPPRRAVSGDRDREENSLSLTASLSSSVRRTTRSEPIRSRTGKSGTSTPTTPGSTAITPGTPPSYSSRTPGTPGTPSYSRTPHTPGTPKSAILVPTDRKSVV